MASPELIAAGLLLKDLYKSATNKISLKKDIVITEEKIAYLHEFLENVQLVKTIWQPEKKVKISEFYQATQIFEDQKPILVEFLDDLPKNSPLIIKGAAGQGKSIFLRHLCSQELIRGEYIPLFAPLRKIDKNYTLTNLLFDTFLEMGLDFKGNENGELFKHFAGSGKLAFLLDGFDEIPFEFQKDTIRILEHLVKRFPNLQVVISSRPHSDIINSDCFDVVEISPLNKSGRNTLIEKLCEDPQQANLLKKAISQKVDIASVITTPLLVTLLVITYKSHQEVPERLSSFYDDVFSTLLSRHDQSKPGFVRKRYSQLNDLEILECFNIISLLSLKGNISKLNEDMLIQLTQKALTEIHKPVTIAKELINDIVRITNLMIQDGDEFHFIHKTIQEYHAAKFISKVPKKVAKAFYEKIKSTVKMIAIWRGVLIFLEEIDKFNFIEQFELPLLCQAFDVSLENPPKAMPFINKEIYLKWSGALLINFVKKENEWGFGTMASVRWFSIPENSRDNSPMVWEIAKSYHPLLEFDCAKSFQAVVTLNDEFIDKYSDAKTKDDPNKNTLSETGYGDIPIYQTLTVLNLWDSFLENFNKTTRLNIIYRRVHILSDFLKNEETTKSNLLDLEF